MLHCRPARPLLRLDLRLFRQEHFTSINWILIEIYCTSHENILHDGISTSPPGKPLRISPNYEMWKFSSVSSRRSGSNFYRLYLHINLPRFNRSIGTVVKRHGSYENSGAGKTVCRGSEEPSVNCNSTPEIGDDKHSDLKVWIKGRPLTLILFGRLEDVAVCITGNMPRLPDGL